MMRVGVSHSVSALTLCWAAGVYRFWQKRLNGMRGSLRVIMSVSRHGAAFEYHCCDWRVYMQLSNMLKLVFLLLMELLSA